MPTISRNKEIRNPAKIGENQELNVFSSNQICP